MPWVKLDDQFLVNPKVMRAGKDGRALYVAGLCFCSSGLTDGFVPAEVVAKLAELADVSRKSTGGAVARLVDVGLWERAEGGFAVHDYLKYQPSAEGVRKERDRVAQWRTEQRTKRVANGYGTVPRADSVPARPLPVRKDGEGNDLVSPARARAPDEPAARRALAGDAEPTRLPNGATQCPTCPDVFTGSYADHLAGPRHRVREVPEDFKRRRSAPGDPPPPEVAAELAALREKPAFDPALVPPDVLAEHERRLQLERSGGEKP